MLDDGDFDIDAAAGELAVDLHIGKKSQRVDAPDCLLDRSRGKLHAGGETGDGTDQRRLNRLVPFDHHTCDFVALRLCRCCGEERYQQRNDP